MSDCPLMMHEIEDMRVLAHFRSEGQIRRKEKKDRWLGLVT